jgi:NADH pyrophosphatase NudC (nudix superfamily)
MEKHLLAMGLAMNLISPSAWAEHAETPTTQTVFVGQQLRLVDDQGQCTLVKPDQSRMKLDMEWPCSFSLNKQQQLRVENFNDIPIFSVWRSEHMPAPSRDCLSKMQAIRQIQGRLEAGAVNTFASCGSGGDQKMYVGPFTW